MPLLLAFPAAASLLPISQTRIRGKPLAADPAGSLFGLILSFHRFLRQLTLRKQWQYFFRREKKVGGSLKPVGEKIK
jgi:hypothetical protein